MKRTFVIGGIILAFGVLFAFVGFFAKKEKDVLDKFAKVKRGLFEVTITGAGELIAEKSVDVTGPDLGQYEGNGGGGSQSRSGEIRASELKIQDMVPEGTIVKKGDYIAQLDKTSYSNSLSDAIVSLQNEQSTLDRELLDSAVVLTGFRDDINNQKFIVNEAETTLRQSKFEPPTTIHEAEIELKKARLSLEEKKHAYQLHVEQIIANIKSQKQNVRRASDLISDLQDFLPKLTITSPGNGIVIYKKDRNGAQIKTGSSLNPFDPVIATLPDLSSMLSKTYVSEIDIGRIHLGQMAEITIDAFPEKKFTGHIVNIANVGEVLPNSDSKMFEVLTHVDGNNPDLKPTMTTGNKIIIRTIDDALYIPAECVQTGPDSIPYVYKKNKTRQIVVLGEANEKNVIIKMGLKEGTSIYLGEPDNYQSFKLKGQKLIAQIKKING
jgi:HlyD family secretion protein